MQPLDFLKESPSQTAGPYVHIGCVPTFAGVEGVYPEDLGKTMITGDAKGEKITLKGRVIDGSGTPLRDAMIEIWQADANGLFNSPVERRGTADPAFTGWGRQGADGDTGVYTFETVKPGRVPFPDGRLQAPHITMWIVARGINIGLMTRCYFEDEAEANAEDPILARVEHKVRIPTLMAKRDGDTYTFDIYLQGDNETIFFDV
ncbi:protocatechuate 3,4-dioxygenase subunit alpha [Mangrovicoccus sp. HB161399]|uniref:protocatechuate 3,4-dioxygenase subunit alpha n=1 Tax=Mangrovicoccus sp. HB161399 TaxID=2720392 RepID=UPI001C12FBF8|nr:protocatechuate 3,4-dioxygenase subunit alpha [Mangrovicoccus sp. HB161399]